MEVIMKPTATKRKMKTKTTILNTKNLKIDAKGPTLNVPYRQKSSKKLKKDVPELKKEEPQDISAKYPILKDEQLVQRFLKVPMNNNQKGGPDEQINGPVKSNGRIRQAVKESLQGTNNTLVPDIIHGKIQAILKSSVNLTDSQLRRIRILYNLLTTALKGEKIVDEKPPPKIPTITKVSTIKPPALMTPTSLKPPQVLETIVEKPRKKVEKKSNSPEKGKVEKEENKDKLVKKVRGPKRYVVFLGNLPLDVDKEKIMAHFSEMNEHIKNIRIPKPKQENRSNIAFMELSNEASFEFALSKHHSMLGKKRINVLYTAQKHGKVSPTEAKSKSAKLIALQKSGKLVGSTPLVKKRSQRRLKQKLAQAQAQAKADAQ